MIKLVQYSDGTYMFGQLMGMQYLMLMNCGHLCKDILGRKCCNCTPKTGTAYSSTHCEVCKVTP